MIHFFSSLFALLYSRLVFSSSPITLGTSGVAAPPSPVCIPGTELRTIRSAYVADEYRLYVAFPPSYHSSDQRYPVLYLLDADVWFGLVTDVLRILHWGEEAPEVLVVGIAHGWEQLDKRDRDFTPAAVADMANSGGAMHFARFLREELIPFVESAYRITPTDRLLVSASLGGLFSTYFLLQHPEVFQRYILMSPWLGYNNRMLFDEEAAFAAQRRSLPIQVFASVGGEEQNFAQDLQDFVAVLRSRGYDGLDIDSVVLEGETHFSQPGRAFTHGMKSLYRRGGPHEVAPR